MLPMCHVMYPALFLHCGSETRASERVCDCVCACVCAYFDARCVETVEHFSDTIAPQRTRICIAYTVENCMPVRSVGTVPQTTTA